GVIMFDARGRVISVPFTIKQGTTLGDLLGFSNANIAQIPGVRSPDSDGVDRTLHTQLGVVLYDREAFLAQPGATEGDFVMKDVNGKDIPTLSPGPALASAEALEEQWLDKNATPLLLDRYSGMLTKGE